MSYLYQWGSPISFLNAQVFSKPSLSKLLDQKITNISCGQDHFFVLTKDKNILGFGLNNKGQLGSQQKNFGLEQQNIRPKIMTKNRIQQISCGWNHTLILDQVGQVLSCGQGTYGALGYGRGTNSDQFKIVSIGLKTPLLQAKITQISAGRDHSLAISQTKVYGWGNSSDNQLGLVKQKVYFQPQQLYIFHSYLCFAGDRCSFFGTDKGLYAVGYNEGGKLGLGHQKKVKMPKKINFQHRVDNIQDGGYILIETNDHQFYLTGNGTLGQFYYPTKIRHFKQHYTTSIGKQFGIIQNSNNSIQTWNFENQPNPTSNQFLSTFNLQKFLCGPKFIIGFSNSPTSQFPDKKLMIKSTISNTLNNNNKLGHQIRRPSGDLNINLNPKYTINQHIIATKNRLSNQQQNLQFFNNQVYGNTKRSEINSIEQNYRENYSQNSEYNMRKENKGIDTPIFIRKRQSSFNQLHQVNNQQDEDSFQGKMILEGGGSFDISNFKKYNLNQEKGKTNNQTESTLMQQIHYLSKQNQRKDKQIEIMKKQMGQLLQIVQSNMDIRKILEARHPNYYQIISDKQYNPKINYSQIPKNKDPFQQNIGKLKSLLQQEYQP